VQTFDETQANKSAGSNDGDFHEVAPFVAQAQEAGILLRAEPGLHERPALAGNIPR